LPTGWKGGQDQAGNTYFYNKELNLTQWNHPGVAGTGDVSANFSFSAKEQALIDYWK
jgi:hypothetical protein